MTWEELTVKMHHKDKYTQKSSIIWPVWLSGCVSVYQISGCGFEFSCSHLNFRFCASFEQLFPWHSGSYRLDSLWQTYVTWQEHIVKMDRTYKYLRHISIIWWVWLSTWMYVSGISSFEFESSCCYLIFTFFACFKQDASWYSGNYRVWTHSETCTWNEKNIKSK